MTFIKRTLFLIIICIVSAIIFSGIVLFLGPKQGFIAWLLVTLLAMGIILFAIIGLFKPRKHPIKKRSTNVMVMLSSIFITAITFVIFVVNVALYEVEDYLSEEQTLNLQQKLDYYKKLSGIDTEEKVDITSMKKKEMDYFTFYYEDITIPQEEMNQIREVIQNNRNSLERLFGKVSKTPVNFILYSSPNKMQVKDLESGQYDAFYQANEQLIHLSLPLDENVLIHEYVHHLFNSVSDEFGISKTDMPVWFEEGVATYIEKKGTVIDSVLLEKMEYTSFRNLEKYGEWEKHLEPPHAPYSQSRNFIEYLVEREGEEIIPQLIQGMEEATLYETFKNETGLDFEEYESTFISEFEDIPLMWEEAHFLHRKESNSEDALAKFLSIADVVPNLLLVNHRIANLYMEVGEYDKAVEYRKKQVRYEDSGTQQSTSFDYLARSLLYIDIDEAIEAAELAVKNQNEEEPKVGDLTASEGLLKEFNLLKDKIENERPFSGYLDFLNGEYAPFIDKEKVGLIDIVLNKYSEISSPEKKKLISLRQKLVNQ